MIQPSTAALEHVVQQLQGLAMHRDAPLSKRTTFGIGGPADLLVAATSDVEVVRVLAAAHDAALPLFVLGGGSNLLVADAGIRGLTLVLRGDLASLRVFNNGRSIEVGCGATYPRLTRTALDLGWPLAVGWMGTPGQVGGALKMNAGTRQGEIGDTVVDVHVATAQSTQRLSRQDCKFGYRTSAFPSGAVLTQALLQCDNRQTEDAEAMDTMAKQQLALRHASQPKLRSAGSIFKNPPGDFAGRLIEQCGLKGFRVGAAAISDVHANFVVNTGGATATDVLAVARRAQHDVQQRFGIELQWEVKRVGFEATDVSA